MMNIKIKPGYLLVLCFAAIMASCEYGRQAEEQLSKFNSQAEDLDAMINEGIKKVNNLDSILPETSKKLKEADSIINDASSTLNYLKQKVNDIENILN